ncbi:hypothetical protein D9615_003391 [Tricholomella constricta]|uniref:Uncharacterized protein n=1 Tax=Tricholomella constricta TaxID=117010 RepID=A0A8H5M7T4_9AGAR|nr:hypothetical protein D9615_003391 [Tricholomella constricta]
MRPLCKLQAAGYQTHASDLPTSNAQAVARILSERGLRLREHLEQSAFHCDDSDDEGNDDGLRDGRTKSPAAKRQNPIEEEIAVEEAEENS